MRRAPLFVVLFLALLVSMISTSALALDGVLEKPALLPISAAPLEWSTHANQHQQHRHLRGLPRVRTPLEQKSEPSFPLTLSGKDLIVYGYLPYWEFDAEIPWSEITHLGYFSVGGSSTGALSNDHGWGSPEQLALLEEAHSHGVRMDLVVTLFNESALHSVLSEPSKRAVFAANLTNLAVSGQADGINLDFEGMPSSVKEDLVSFVLELSATLWEVLPDAEISLAMPAVDWSGAYDYDLLGAASDFLFIMCYGYHWSGGSPGPNAPLDSVGPWSHKSINWTIDDYVEWGGGEGALENIVIGLPSYGHNWPTTSSDIPGTKVSKASAKSYRNLQNTYGFENFTTEPESGEKYYVYQEGQQWHQIFADDGETTAAKVTWVLERGVRGYGFWALGYDANDPNYWEPIRDGVGLALGAPVPPIDLAPFQDGGSVPPDAGSTRSQDNGADDLGLAMDSTPHETAQLDLMWGAETNDVSNQQEPNSQVAEESTGCSAKKRRNEMRWVFLLFMLFFMPGMRHQKGRKAWAKATAQENKP